MVVNHHKFNDKDDIEHYWGKHCDEEEMHYHRANIMTTPPPGWEPEPVQRTYADTTQAEAMRNHHKKANISQRVQEHKNKEVQRKKSRAERK